MGREVKEDKHNSVSLSQIQQARPTIVLTFDDGFASHYHTAFDILQDNNLVGTFFVCAGGSLAIGSPGRMTSGQLQEMYSYGNEIGSHGYSHTDFSAIQPKERLYEIMRNNDFLTNWLLNPVSFAYPYGNVTSGIAYMVSCFHKCGRTVLGSGGHAFSFPHAINFYVPSISLYELSDDLLNELITKREVLTLLYHDIVSSAWLKTICEKIASRLDDIDCRTFGEVFGARHVEPMPNCHHDAQVAITTTDSYQLFSLFTGMMNKVSILIRNTGGINSATYRIVGYFSHYRTNFEELVASTALAPNSNAYHHISDWYEVLEVQFKSTNSGQTTSVFMEWSGN